jgi:hypothetical protein
MASTAISVVTALISGAAAGSHATTFSTAETITIYGPGVGDIDFSTLFISIKNSSAATAILASLDASDKFSDTSLGDYSFTVASGATVFIGGKDFESSRFKQIGSGGTVSTVINIGAATAGAVITAVQAP